MVPFILTVAGLLLGLIGLTPEFGWAADGPASRPTGNESIRSDEPNETRGRREASEPRERERFQGSGLCRFLVEDYELTSKTENAVNRAVEEAMKKHETVFGFKADPAFRVRIRIFGRFEDFERYTRTNQFARQLIQSSQSISNLGGYYSHGLRHIVTWRQRHATDLGNTLLHEASHAILHSAFRRIPIWLSEGSATYFAYPRHMQDNRDIGGLQYRWAKLNVLLRSGQLSTVRALVNLTDAEWARLDPAVSYNTAWSLFQVMMTTPERQELMRQYLRAIQSQGGRRRGGRVAGDAPGDAGTAGVLDALWPGGLAQLEKDWHGWIRQGGARVLGPDMEELLQQVR